MSPEVGPISISPDGSRFLELKLPWERERSTSEQLARIADAEVARLVSEAYDRAKSLLTKHEPSLRAVAEELKRTGVLEGKQLREIVDRVESGKDAALPEGPAIEVEARESG